MTDKIDTRREVVENRWPLPEHHSSDCDCGWCYEAKMVRALLDERDNLKKNMIDFKELYSEGLQVGIELGKKLGKTND